MHVTRRARFTKKLWRATLRRGRARRTDATERVPPTTALSGFALLLLVFAVSARADLAEYVSRPEPEFRWEKRNQTEAPEGTLTELHFVSQVWQDIRWEHTLQIYRPRKVVAGRPVILQITGGNPDQNRQRIATRMALETGAMVVVLFNIPNQPLFGGLTEDNLVAHTFVKTLETRDTTWPLLLPMTKAAVKAMDVVQAFADQEWHEKVEGFVVTGASKRGWTTWLTAAVDSRVRAIAPMVFDNLNFPKQMPNQIATWGGYSDNIKEYTQRNLQAKLATKEGAVLSRLVDPYSYRDRLTMPKLIINGANDHYWTIDALNLYWNDLLGEKHVLYVPNAGHNLRDDRQRSIASLIAFYRHVADNTKFPTLTWTSSADEKALHFKITSDVAPRNAVLWSAQSATKDIRDAQWQSSPLQHADDAFTSDIPRPAAGWVTVFGELTFDQSGKPYYLSTAPQQIDPP